MNDRVIKRILKTSDCAIALETEMLPSDTIRRMLEEIVEHRRLKNQVKSIVEALEKCRHDECIDPHFTFKCKCPKCEALTQYRESVKEKKC